MNRPTIKQLQDLAFELHSIGLEECIAAHREKNADGLMTGEGYIRRGKALAYKEASKQLRDLFDLPKPQPKSKEEKK